MSDSPAPISYINDENETSNNPSIAEEKNKILVIIMIIQKMLKQIMIIIILIQNLILQFELHIDLNLIGVHYLLYLQVLDLELLVLIFSSKMIIL